jgi:Tubulin binding cofactor C
MPTNCDVNMQSTCRRAWECWAAGCTIVVGAVAGLLHIVDCEKLKLTTAARRILVSNSSSTCSRASLLPSLLCLCGGGNRSCHLAPYNTYYDGMREDLLATGLAAAVISEGQYGGGGLVWKVVERVGDLQSHAPTHR